MLHRSSTVALLLTLSCFAPGASAETDWDLMHKAVKQQNGNDLLRVTERMLAKDPNDFAATMNHGVALFWLGKRAEGKTELHRAAKLRPNEEAPHSHLLNIYIAEQQWDAALAEANAALKANPNHADVYVLKAKVLLTKRRYKEALAQLDIAENKYARETPNTTFTAAKLCALCALGRLDEARHYAKEIDVKNGVDWLTVVWIANDIASQGMNDRAYALMRLCPDPASVDGASYILTYCSAALDKVDDVQKYGSILWKQRPQEIHARRAVGAMYARLGMYSSAEKVLTAVPAAHRNILDYWWVLYDVHAHLRKDDEALADLTHVVALAKSDEKPDYLVRRAEAYLRVGDTTNALADVTSAIKLRPTGRELYRKRADIYEEMGNVRAALADRAKANSIQR